MDGLGAQLLFLVMLAIPIASISWTVTHEEVFREPREFFTRRSQESPRLLERKFFYLFTCEYCFSHWVSLGAIVVTGFRFLFDDWRGFFLALFALVWVANVYMSIFGRLRLTIKREGKEIAVVEKKLEEEQPPAAPPERRTLRRAP